VHAYIGSPAATVKLGGSDLEVSRLGIGTIRWGDTSKGFDPSSTPVCSPQPRCRKRLHRISRLGWHVVEDVSAW
jgi:hypothetical protein